jgi:hypothetical protein
MTEPKNWAAEMQALQDQVERLTLELEVCKNAASSAQYWEGLDAGVMGTAQRWQEALTDPIPKPGVMGSVLESPYRQTEQLRLDLQGFHGQAEALASVKADLAFVRGQRDGYAYLLHATLEAMNAHWAPHDETSASIRRVLQQKLGASVDAAWAAMQADREKP